jgi:hypothetical protein
MFIVASCGPSSTTEGVQPQNVDAVEVYKAGESGFHDSVRELVTDSIRWKAIWEEAGAPMLGNPMVPAIDFSRYSVLVALGHAWEPEMLWK